MQLTGDFDNDSVADITLNAVTDANGIYEFPNLAPGSYTVSITPPTGYVPTADADGIATPNTSTVALTAGSQIQTQDFGYAGTGSVGNLIFNDVDNSNSQTTGDTGISGVTVNLQLDINGDSVADFTASTTTDSNGLYQFINLLPGTYTLGVSSTGFAAATSPAVDPDGTNDGTTTVSLTPGSTNLNQDLADPTGLRALTDYEIRVNAAEFLASGTLGQFVVTQQNQSPVLVARTTQTVSGAAEFDSNIDLIADTARSQRIDVLTSTGLATDGVKVIITNATGGFARIDEDQTVVFEFTDGSIAGTFEFASPHPVLPHPIAEGVIAA